MLAFLGEQSGETEGWGSAAYLTRDAQTGDLLVVALNERIGAVVGYDVTLWRELDESLPGPASSCPSCRAAVDGWTRFCSCGADLSGIAPGTEEEWRRLEERFVQATTGELELLGTLPFAGSGGWRTLADR